MGFGELSRGVATGTGPGGVGEKARKDASRFQQLGQGPALFRACLENGEFSVEEEGKEEGARRDEADQDPILPHSQ